MMLNIYLCAFSAIFISLLKHLFKSLPFFKKLGGFFFFFFFPIFRAAPLAYVSFPGKGSNPSCSCWPTPQPWHQQIAMPDLNRICDLHHNSSQHQILNQLSEARNQTSILMDTSRVLNPLSHNGNSR